MNIGWERSQAVRVMGHVLETLDKLGLVEWELWWLTDRDWSMYAIRR